MTGIVFGNVLFVVLVTGNVCNIVFVGSFSVILFAFVSSIDDDIVVEILGVSTWLALVVGCRFFSIPMQF